MGENLLTFKELKTRKGWPFSRQYTARLVSQGRFPVPFKTEAGNVNLWYESDIDNYFASRAKVARSARQT